MMKCLVPGCERNAKYNVLLALSPGPQYEYIIAENAVFQTCEEHSMGLTIDSVIPPGGWTIIEGVFARNKRLLPKKQYSKIVLVELH